MASVRKKKILILGNSHLVVFKFRGELISTLVERGYDVWVCFPNGPFGEGEQTAKIYGCHFIENKMERRGTNPIKDRVYQIIRDWPVSMTFDEPYYYRARITANIDSLKADLKEKKASLKVIDKEIFKLEAKKAKADAKVAEEAKKAEAEAVLKKLLAEGMSADEILAKLK